MGPRVFTIDMSARPGSGDPLRLQHELWRMLRATIGHWIKTDGLVDIARYLDQLPATPNWQSTPYELNFTFEDDATGSAAAVLHWVELAVGAEWNRVCRRAEKHGFTVLSQRPPRWPAERFALVRDRLWAVSGTADTPVLQRGADRLGPDDLSTAERGIVAAALVDCGCLPCRILRPDPALEQTLVSMLTERGDARDTVQWYLARTRSLPPLLAAALARVCEQDPSSSWGLLDAVQRAASWGGLLQVDGHGLGVTAVRLAWMIGGGRLPEEDVPVDPVPLLKKPAPLCGLAAEVAASACQHDPAPAAAEMLGILDREVDPRVRYHAVRGLSNLYLVARTMPPPVEQALRREASQEDGGRSESVALARMVVDHLNGATPGGW